ncbi:MAG: PaaI family thioesterase [Thaumarchaeota archaeon]|nr:PaaI family thioesterase [Nitrososphaerota archaeon]
MKKSLPRTEPSPASGLEGIRRAMAQGWRPPVADLVGFRLTEIKKGRAKVELEAGQRHENPMGTTHGGIICDIADAAMGMSYASLLLPDESFTTVELKVNFLRPFWRGRLIASGKVIKKGRLMGLVECRVTDERLRLVAYATSTCLALQGVQGQGLVRPKRDASPG